jgi:hypothetical protein
LHVLAAQELALKVRARGQEYNPFKARRALENRELRPDAAKKRRKGSKPDGSKPDGSALSADVQARHHQGRPLAGAAGDCLRGHRLSVMQGWGCNPL